MNSSEAVEALKLGKEVEYLSLDDTWHRLSSASSIDLLLDPNHEFRIKPQEMVTIGDVSFPKPLTELPDGVDEVFIPDFFYDMPFCAFRDKKDIEKFVEYGVAHLTSENAIAHAKALIRLSGGSYDKDI